MYVKKIFVSGKLFLEKAHKLVLGLEFPTSPSYLCICLSPGPTLQNPCNRILLVFATCWLPQSHIFFLAPSVLSPQQPTLIQVDNVFGIGLGIKFSIYTLQYCSLWAQMQVCAFALGQNVQGSQISVLKSPLVFLNDLRFYSNLKNVFIDIGIFKSKQRNILTLERSHGPLLYILPCIIKL